MKQNNNTAGWRKQTRTEQWEAKDYEGHRKLEEYLIRIQDKREMSQ